MTNGDSSEFNDAVPFQCVMAFYRNHNRQGESGPGEWVYQWGYAWRVMYSPEKWYGCRYEGETQIVWSYPPTTTKHYPSGDDWEQKLNGRSGIESGTPVIQSASGQGDPKELE